jgi:PAS domain S-box-containing protein
MNLPPWLHDSPSFYAIAVDMQGNYSYVNNLFKTRFAFLKEDFIGTPMTDSVYSEDIPVCVKAAEDCVSNPSRVIEVNIRKPLDNKGNFYWTKWQFSLIQNEDGTPNAILGVGYDITDETTTQIKLDDVKSRLRSILNSTFDMYFLVDRNYKVLEYNRVAAHMIREYFGKELSDNRHVLDFVVADQRQLFFECFAKCLDEQVVKGEALYRIKDIELWLSYLYYPVFDEHGTLVGVAISLRNVDKRKRYELKLIRQNKLLREIAWKESHELRGPLATIMGLIEQMRDYKSEISEEEREQYLAGMLEEAHKLDDVVRDIVHRTDQIEL